MLPAIQVKAPTKYELLKKCWIKEAEGYECVRKIEKQHDYKKRYVPNKNGRMEYVGSDEFTYYDAYYRKMVD